jgi:serine/threonine-protein kinase
VVEPGRRCLGDRYELQRLIAAGGMGQVWRGVDVALHRPVAIKVLRSEYTGDPTFLARFRAEAQHAASLSHPNIAAVFDYGEEIAQDGTGETMAYLVMELVEGEPLSALLAREGALPTETTLSLLSQTAFALGEAHHAGMVHRDVKPGNILVRPDGSVKITDFGIAWSARSVALTRTGQVIGTPQYLSPEQAEGRPATPASDVYALGLIGYECLSGHPAFEGDNAVTIALKQVREQPAALPGDVPAGVRGLISQTLAKDPAARLRDGAAVVAAIEDIAAGRPVPELAVLPPAAEGAGSQGGAGGPATGILGPVTRPPVQRQRNRGLVVLLPVLGLLAGAGLAIALLQTLAAHRPPATAQAAEQRQTQGVVLVARDYVGRPIEDVAGQLAAYGLAVQRRLDPTPPRGAAPGTVTDVAPTGVQLRPGSVVVVRYVAPQSGPLPGGGSSGVTETALTHAAAPSTRGSAPSSAAGSASAGPTTAGAPGTTSLAASGSETSAASSSSASSSSPAASSTPSETSSPPASSSPPEP